jgi:endonuclease G
VVTGPIFDEDRERMASGIEIPDAFYKIIFDENEQTRELRFLPFLIPQDVRGTESLNTFLTSIDTIEQQTGFDFFWALNDPHEDFLEALSPKTLW